MAAPTTASSRIAGYEVGPRGQEHDRDSPECEREPKGDGKSPPSERQRSDRADQATDPDGRRHIADRFPTCIEDLECGDDDEDVEAAADEGLRNDQENDQAGPRCPRDGSKPSREDAPRASLGSGRRGEVDAAFDLDPREERCAHKKCSGTEGEHEPDIRNGDEHARDQRSEECSQALDRRGRGVRCNELLRSSGERRQQGLQRGPDERACEPEQGRKSEDQDNRIRIGGSRRSAERERSDETHREQEALPPEPIAE